jgi:hypothetical protein
MSNSLPPVLGPNSVLRTPQGAYAVRPILALTNSNRKIPPTRHFLRFVANRLSPLLFQLLETTPGVMAKPIQHLQPSLGF